MKSLLIYIERSFLLYNRKENITLELEFSYLTDMLLYVYVYVYNTIHIYTSIFMFHVKHLYVKHLYVALYNCIYNCILFLDMIFSELSIIVLSLYTMLFMMIFVLFCCDNLVKILLFLCYFLCDICYNCVLYLSL